MVQQLSGKGYKCWKREWFDRRRNIADVGDHPRGWCATAAVTAAAAAAAAAEIDTQGARPSPVRNHGGNSGWGGSAGHKRVFGPEGV